MSAAVEMMLHGMAYRWAPWALGMPTFPAKIALLPKTRARLLEENTVSGSSEWSHKRAAWDTRDAGFTDGCMY